MTTTPAGSQPPTAPIVGAWQPLPNAGAAPHDTDDQQKKTINRWIARGFLAVIMAGCIAVGTWSIYTLLTGNIHAPMGIGLLGAGVFDVAALYFAFLGQQYATSMDSGLGPRIAMLCVISLSVYINWTHAQIAGWGTIGGIVLASPSVVAEVAFEMWHKFEHRDALRRLGRIAQTLPVLGKWAWIAHPFRSRKTIDAHIRAALTEHEAVAERRMEIAGQRAQAIVSVPLPTVTLEQLSVDQSALTPTTLNEHAPAPALTPPAERLALTTETAPSERAHTLTEPQTRSERPAQPDTLSPTERAHKPSTSTERAQTAAQGASSLGERKALHERQDALTLTLWQTLNARPEWTEIRDALTAGGLERVSRPTAQRIRERVQNAHPELPTERPKTLTAAE